MSGKHQFCLWLALLMLITFFASCSSDVGGNPPSTSGEDTSSGGAPTEEVTTAEGKAELNTTPFTNPVSHTQAPDPFMTYDRETGYYYLLYTLGDRLELFRSRQAADITLFGESKVIYRANGPRDGIYGDIWAPEMHKGSDGKWYIYTSGRITEAPGQKRLFIVRALSDDPFGEWEFVRMPTPGIFSIDPTMYTAPDGTQYICYSRVDPTDGQVLEICKMTSPLYCDTRKVTIAKAELDWELDPPTVGNKAIVEGAFFLERNGRLFLIYSANGCWQNKYALGVLEHMGGDLCDAGNWKKHPEPLLTYGNGVYGPGHASFFYSPDGSEVWCAYHGMLASNDSKTPAERYMNLQKVEFDETGYPVMGTPIGYETEMLPPSGELAP